MEETMQGLWESIEGAAKGLDQTNKDIRSTGDIFKSAMDTMKQTLLGGTAIAMSYYFQDYFAAMFRQQLQVIGKIVSEVIFAPIQLYTESLQMIFKAFSSVANRLGTAFIDLHKILDESVSNFFKLTQASEGYTSVIRNSIDELRKQGLQLEGVSDAAAGLYRNTVLFRDSVSSTQTRLITFVQTLEQAGISGESTTRAIQILNKTFGDTGAQTQAATESIVHFSRSVGVASSDAMEGMGQAATTLAAHGQNMTRVYKELLVQMRATGLGTQQLLGIAERFDTFEQAASSVSMLNSLLGGPYLNSIEMVYKSETERNRAVLEAIELSGKSWATMDRFERKAFAGAVGIRDMAQATEFFSTSLRDFDNNLAKSAENARKQEA